MTYLSQKKNFWQKLNYGLKEVPIVFSIGAVFGFLAIATTFGSVIQFMASDPEFLNSSFMAFMCWFVVAGALWSIKQAMDEY